MQGKTGLLVLVILLACVVHSESIAASNNLSLDNRIFYQEKIERIYWQERIWPDKNTSKPSFENLISREIVQKKVEDYLRKAKAIEVYWHKPIQESQIQAEMDRMVRNTKNPKMLQKIFDALNNDPDVIAQCLALPSLANRLIRNRYSSDAVFHADEKSKASQDASLITNAETMQSTSGKYYELNFSSNDDLTEFNEINSQYSKLKLRQVSKIQEDSERFYVFAVLERSEKTLKVAIVEWKKESFDSWWRIASKDIPIAVPNFNRTAFSLRNTINQSDCVDQTWTSIPAAPQPRTNHVTFWTGSEMLIWGGGSEDYGGLKNGAKYDPITDTWLPISTNGAPGPYASAVWTGSEMILWDGTTGGRYNPASDTWSPISTINAPQTGGAVWTGNEMIIWNGNSGGRYNPSTDSWSPISNVGAPGNGPPVWTGSEMIIWDGDSGGRYNPSNDTWTAISIVNAPSPRSSYTAVWTGIEMIIYGGNWETTGGRYNPTSDSWTPTSTIGTPCIRETHRAVWTGNEMIIWGGNSFCDTGAGGKYNPFTDTWMPTSTVNAPSGRTAPLVWTGSEMIVWGGDYYDRLFDDGGRYDPVADSWIPINNGSITTRRLHTAVWTGVEMIIWGGTNGTFFDLNSGGIYDPTTNSWTTTNEADAPSERRSHTAVWSGSEMIVWGGSSSQPGSFFDTGGRYNPSSDSWIPTDVSQAPGARDQHSAIWTGNQMVIWGGYSAGPIDPTGGIYQPDSWSPTNTVGAPEGRWLHTANWTGSEMIVWGGQVPNIGAINTGGKYNPLTDSWLPMNNTDAPSPRYYHSAIWSGEELLVWGGDSNPGTLGDGKRYLPSDDSWTDISSVNSPSPRRKHTAVQAGGQMIIWGGVFDYSNFLNDGAIYFVNDDSWSQISTLNAPNARAGHTAVWTGTQMIVWGGVPFDASGGLYCLTVPTAFDDAYSIDENSTVNIPAPGVLTNDVDPQNDVLTAELVSEPANGVVTLNSDGSFVYTPDIDFVGTDSFVYRCKDATYFSNDATVSIYVGNQLPIANPDTANTSEDTSVTIDVLLNDSDPDGDPINVVNVTTPQNGTAVINLDDTITYTPNPGFSGTDSFDYTIDDGHGGTDSASVTITVAANQPPVANADTANTSENTPVIIDVLSNDSDPEGDPIHVISVTNPQNGTAVINPDDTITYTPNATFSGTDSFDYTIDDGHGNTASASVTITVAANCLFCDDFEDGVLATDWTYVKGSWSESNGSLIGDPSGKKSLAIANPAFNGCSTCTVQTSMESDGSAFGKVWLFSWYVDKHNRVELLMNEAQDKWIVKQRVGGVVVAKSKSISTIDPNTFYDVSLQFDGTSIILKVNGTELINLPAVGTPYGTIGFQNKKTVSRFGYININ
jgi:N-acetylneuraminic acid mutarotase